MTMKRVFLTLLAALLLPGLAYAQTNTRATFTVQKNFYDGNSVTDVTVNIQCFTGVPLNQSQTVNPDNSGEFEVEFVVESFNNEELDCDVWEDPVNGYSADYDVGYNNADDYTDSGDACEFEDVASGGSEEDQNLCTITNHPDPVEIVIHKDWVIDGSGGNELDPGYKLKLYCYGEILGEDVKHYEGKWSKKFWNESGSNDESYTAEVIPYWNGGTGCWVDETVYDSSVEVDNPCGRPSDSQEEPVYPLVAEIGEGDSCTITNTVFYEGIPTLSQYGMAILALLMLGVGFVGFRRFV